MALNLRDLRRRIQSVQNTQQITQAMKMVAAAKLRRAQERAENSRPYGEAMKSVLEAVLPAAGAVDLPLLHSRPVQRRAVVVITADRGLCGSYNAQILRQALIETGQNRDVTIVAVGRKARDFFRRHDFSTIADFSPIGDEPHYHQAENVGEEITRLFLAGEVDKVDLIYAHFVNSATYHPQTQELLPLVLKTEEQGEAPQQQFLFEPSPEGVLAELLPQYLNTLIYRSLLEAKASEHGARMTAMDAATQNCDELVRNLVLLRNRVRQATITQELTEIVGGAAALD